MPSEIHGSSNDKNSGLRPRVCMLSILDHVCHNAWGSIIKRLYGCICTGNGLVFRCWKLQEVEWLHLTWYDVSHIFGIDVDVAEFRERYENCGSNAKSCIYHSRHALAVGCPKLLEMKMLFWTKSDFIDICFVWQQAYLQISGSV